MANATIDALYAGSLRLKCPISFLNIFTFYKWCITKVAHCNLNKLGRRPLGDASYQISSFMALCFQTRRFFMYSLY